MRKLKRQDMAGNTMLEQAINFYLTTQFISSSYDTPKDECLSEAKVILEMITHVFKLKPTKKRKPKPS